MLWYLGPSAVLIGLLAFAVIVGMSIFGTGSFVAWLRRRGRP